MMVSLYVSFFFSSRRRHTRFDCDWSSDVCSSDLAKVIFVTRNLAVGFDAIVIGAGMAGSAAAWQLSRDGRRVLLLEQFEIGHARGSSHGESRIFRFAYPQAEYAKFAMQSKPLWLELERDSGKKLLHSIGGLDFADDPECFGEVRQIASALRQNGASCEE